MPKFQLGDIVRKISGSMWQGAVVGTYSTSLTPEGYAVESSAHRGSVQIYPASALELVVVKADSGVQKDDPRGSVL
jgi:dihydrofolate reductase (trimethoprim resistance protein)